MPSKIIIIAANAVLVGSTAYACMTADERRACKAQALNILAKSSRAVARHAGEIGMKAERAYYQVVQV